MALWRIGSCRLIDGSTTRTLPLHSGEIGLRPCQRPALVDSVPLIVLPYCVHSVEWPARKIKDSTSQLRKSIFGAIVLANASRFVVPFFVRPGQVLDEILKYLEAAVRVTIGG